MFIGTYQHNIDDKGRVIIPASFRADLGEKSYLCKGLDGCLFVFPKDEWEVFIGGLRSQQPTRQNRDIIRYFLAGAAELELDKQGRAVIPQHLRDHAKISSSIYITGAGGRLEIWNKDLWEQTTSSIKEENIEEAFENISFAF